MGLAQFIEQDKSIRRACIWFSILGVGFSLCYFSHDSAFDLGQIIIFVATLLLDREIGIIGTGLMAEYHQKRQIEKRHAFKAERKTRSDMKRARILTLRESSAAAKSRLERARRAAAETTIRQSQKRTVEQMLADDRRQSAHIALVTSSHDALSDEAALGLEALGWSITRPDPEATFDMLLSRQNNGLQTGIARCAPPGLPASDLDVNAVSAWIYQSGASIAYLISVHGFTETAIALNNRLKSHVVLVDAYMLATWKTAAFSKTKDSKQELI